MPKRSPKVVNTVQGVVVDEVTGMDYLEIKIGDSMLPEPVMFGGS